MNALPIENIKATTIMILSFARTVYRSLCSHRDAASMIQCPHHHIQYDSSALLHVLSKLEIPVLLLRILAIDVGRKFAVEATLFLLQRLLFCFPEIQTVQINYM
jgi:hypothetical protein